MPGRRWKCLKHWTDDWQCNTKGVSSPPRKRLRDQVSCAASALGTVHTTVPSRYTNGVTRRPEDDVESMGTLLEADRLRDDADRNGAARVRRTATPRPRKPTPLQTARWKAVQKAKRKGLSIRGIAREVGIHRETVRKYIHAESPPMARPRNVGSTPA